MRHVSWAWPGDWCFTKTAPLRDEMFSQKDLVNQLWGAAHDVKPGKGASWIAGDDPKPGKGASWKRKRVFARPSEAVRRALGALREASKRIWSIHFQDCKTRHQSRACCPCPFSFGPALTMLETWEKTPLIWISAEFKMWRWQNLERTRSVWRTLPLASNRFGA
jgi:hypothetical protein